MTSSEVVPSADESFPQIPPNLASNKDLCEAVAKYIHTEFAIPYIAMASRLTDNWRRVDQSWRAKIERTDLDISMTQEKTGTPGFTADGKFGSNTSNQDPMKAKIQPSVVHKQFDAITNLYTAISFEGGELPVKARERKNVFEHPLYSPTEQAVNLANAILQQNAGEVDLKIESRKAFSTFGRYGHAVVHIDLEREMEEFERAFPLPPEPTQAQLAIAQLSQQFQQQPKVIPGMNGPQAIFRFQRIKTFKTNFVPLDVDQVFFDENISCKEMERQPCPFFRTHITRFDLEKNLYSEQNPFGWLNTELAMEENGHHYVLSQPDEAAAAQRAKERYGLSDNYLTKSRNTIKQLWTVYPLLALDEERGLLDTGEGVDCPSCQGSRKVLVQEEVQIGDNLGVSNAEGPCPTCNATGKVHIPAKRYVVQLFGNLYSSGSTTCLRIQRNPTAKDKIPLAYGAHLVEDTSSSRPMSKFEVVVGDVEQNATAWNQLFDSKNAEINRPWIKHVESPMIGHNCNIPGKDVLWRDRPDENVRVPGGTFDNTATLIPAIQMTENNIKNVLGATDSVLGQASSGRRSAVEMSNVIEAGKLPLVVQIDLFNSQIMRKWGQMVLDNLEVYGDRDFLRRKTGMSSFTGVELFTEVADEFVKQLAMTQNARYILESTKDDPLMIPVRPRLYEILFKTMGINIPSSDFDGGMKKAQQDAFNILTTILGDGQYEPADPSDPHEIYIEIFTQALKDKRWQEKAPQNLPLLWQRLQENQMYLQQQQMQQLQAQLQQMQLEQSMQPQKEKRQAENGGQVAQQTLGAAMGG